MRGRGERGHASAGLPRARPAGTPTVLALTATHPSSAALGSLSAHLSSIGLLSPGWLALQPGGRFSYNAEDALPLRSRRAAYGSCRCSRIRSILPAPS